MSLHGLYGMLANPYYFGIVRYRGVHYQGSHEPLISAETWLRIQDVLASRGVAGEKTREHPHYLKDTIYCEACGSRLIYSQNKGHGGTYEYFVCLGRMTKNGCPVYSIKLEKIELGRHGVLRPLPNA